MTDTPTREITQEAAREMLAALRKAVDAYRAPHPVFDPGTTPHQWWLDARAAIARATGGEARS